jgi:ABC-type glycerol-3-phosphate transport system permease component
MALTAGGPGFSTDLPATFMYAMAFTRGQIGLGAACRHGDAGHRGGHRGALPVQRAEDQEVSRFAWHRALLWTVLLLFAAWFLLPLYVMVSTSLKDMDQVRAGHLLSLPTSPSFDAWAKAWGTACTGVDCGGLQPFFMNSVLMVVPAVLVSTAIGALNGYVLSKWRFRGSETLFALLLFGVFMPMQVVLLPMSQVLGWLGIASSIWGLILVHVVAGLPSTTLFFRNYYVGLPDELVRRPCSTAPASGRSSGASCCRCPRRS